MMYCARMKGEPYPRFDRRRAPSYDGGTVCLGISILVGMGLGIVWAMAMWGGK